MSGELWKLAEDLLAEIAPRVLACRRELHRILKE
jgi:hypothetical protein